MKAVGHLKPSQHRAGHRRRRGGRYSLSRHGVRRGNRPCPGWFKRHGPLADRQRLRTDSARRPSASSTPTKHGSGASRHQARSNLMLTRGGHPSPEGQVKVLDLGFGPGYKARCRSATFSTASDCILGTFDYVPRRSRATIRMMPMLAARRLTGLGLHRLLPPCSREKPPFAAKYRTPLAKTQGSRLGNRHPRSASFVRRCPKRLARVVDKLLAKDPAPAHRHGGRAGRGGHATVHQGAATCSDC